jgi:hypothetical protein
VWTLTSPIGADTALGRGNSFALLMLVFERGQRCLRPQELAKFVNTFLLIVFAVLSEVKVLRHSPVPYVGH